MARKPTAVERGTIRIGCAGWSVRAEQSSLFGEGDSHLSRYATRFDAVEINSSFYRPHQQKTYARWAASVPPTFRFSVKLPKAITHAARLIDADQAIVQFCDEVDGLGDKLGGVLVQLPPSLRFDAEVAETFFATLRRRTQAPVACEPRHPSWFGPDVDRLWQRYLVTRVAADPARCPDASEVGGAGALRYWRWHGSPRMYYSAYDDAVLNSWLWKCVCMPQRGGLHGASSTTPRSATPQRTPSGCGSSAEHERVSRRDDERRRGSLEIDQDQGEPFGSGLINHWSLWTDPIFWSSRLFRT